MQQLELLMRGVNTRRFHTVPTISCETVGHHSAIVAGLVFLIDAGASASLLIHATFHDLPEFMTGDIPSPSKRAFVDRNRLDEAEVSCLQKFGVQLPVLTQDEQRLLKVADILAGMVACLHERSMGNVMVTEAWYNFSIYFSEQPSPHPRAVAILDHLQRSWRALGGSP